MNGAGRLGDTGLVFRGACAPRTHARHCGAGRCDCLAEALEAASHARLFMHHAPMEVGVPAKDKITLVAEDRPRLKAVLERFADRIDYIHFGHVHAPIHGCYCGIPFASVPSLGNQALPDFDEPDMLLGGPLQPAYYVILVDGRATRMHAIPFAYDRPIFATGTGWNDWAKPEAAE